MVIHGEPFINDMCLTGLVAVRHQVERELVFLAARTNVGPTIARKEYDQNVAKRRKEWRNQDSRRKLEAELNLQAFAEWDSMEVLRHLVNCVKHDPTQEPGEELLKHLNLPLEPEGTMVVGYAPLSESDRLRERLAESVNLPPDADYCTIAETFVNLADQFLKKVRQETKLAQVTPTPLVGCVV